MSSEQGPLRLLLDSGQGEVDVDILLVPGVGTTNKADDWSFASAQWLSKAIPGNLNRARIFAFDYSVSVTESDVSTQQFLVQGDVLLNALAHGRSGGKSQILFAICHSLGGLVLKQALCIAHEQAYRYGSILGSVAGIVFLGTPHKGHNDADTLTRCLTILSSTSGHKKPISLPPHRATLEATMLKQLAERFEDVHLQPPVLSLVEDKKTRVYLGMLKYKSLLLSDIALCATNSPFETLRTLPLDHGSLHRVEQTEKGTKDLIDQFVRNSLGDAMRVVTARLAALDFVHATTSTYSPVHSDSNSFSGGHGPSPQIRHESTGKAAVGSSNDGFEIVPTLQHNVPKKATVNLPCIMLETNGPSRVFFGQEKILDMMEQALVPANARASESGLRQFALCGLGGMGKTELATEFASRNRDKFDAIFWVRADEAAKLDQCFVDMSIQLGLETAQQATSHVVSRSLVKGWLANPVQGDLATSEDISSTASGYNDASWLIIFDNADDPKLLGDYWPEGTGSVLITSRDPLAKRLYSSNSSGMDLEPLDDSAGGALLLELANSGDSLEDNSESIAQEISRSLAGLPLAIAQMASIIRRQELSLTEFQSIYEEDKDRLALYSTKYNTSTKAYEHSIATVWAFEKLSSTAKGLIKLMLFMDPDVIQESILFDAAKSILQSSSFSRPQFNEARAELSQSSLIRRDKKKTAVSDYQISIHRLVQDAIRAGMTNEELVSNFETMVDLLLQKWPPAMPPPTKTSQILQHEIADTRLSVTRYPLCVALYPHVFRLKQMWPLASSCSHRTKIRFAAILTDAAWYQWEMGRFRGFDGFFDLAQRICETTACDDSESILCALHFSLGVIYARTNDFKLGRIHTQAFLDKQKATCESIGLNFVDNRLGMAYAEMAMRYTQDGEFDEAIEAFRREREIRKKLGITTMVSRDANCAMTLLLRGDLDEAERLLLESVKLWESTGSVMNLRIGRVYQGYGHLRQAQGRLAESYDYDTKALHCFIDATGPRSQWTAMMRHRCALHLIRMKRHQDAITMINAALETWSLNPDLFQPELARTTWVKAKLLEDLGESLKASVAFKVVARIRDKIVPGDTRDVRELDDNYFDHLIEYLAR